MVTVRITKAQLIALLLAYGEIGDIDHMVEKAATSPLLTYNGCKVSAFSVGAVMYYTLSGYSHDGSDVRGALARIMPRPTARWSNQEWDMCYCDVTRSGQLSHSDRQIDCPYYKPLSWASFGDVYGN